MRNLALPFLLAVIPGAAATVDLTWFTSESEFEAFVLDQGNSLTGIENYEESTLLPNSAAFIPDPLEPGVPNGPFPNGLEGVDNMIVQANILGGDPNVPAPHSAAFPDEDGLAVASWSNMGFQSDVVVPYWNIDSLDLVLLDQNITAVGIDIVSILGLGVVDIRVYDTNNVLVGMMGSPADPTGVDFFGVWCPAPIGRINIHDPGHGVEGGDNIQIWTSCGACPTDVDGSGDTGAADLAVLLGSWGPCAPGEACACLDADGDGLLGPADLAVLLGAWGLCL